MRPQFQFRASVTIFRPNLRSIGSTHTARQAYCFLRLIVIVQAAGKPFTNFVGCSLNMDKFAMSS